MKENWTVEEITIVESYLIIKGDFIVKSGQSGLAQACAALPKDPSQMNTWCQTWVSEEGCRKLLSALQAG